MVWYFVFVEAQTPVTVWELWVYDSPIAAADGGNAVQLIPEERVRHCRGDAQGSLLINPTAVNGWCTEGTHTGAGRETVKFDLCKTFQRKKLYAGRHKTYKRHLLSFYN